MIQNGRHKGPGKWCKAPPVLGSHFNLANSRLLDIASLGLCPEKAGGPVRLSRVTRWTLYYCALKSYFWRLAGIANPYSGYSNYVRQSVLGTFPSEIYSTFAVNLGFTISYLNFSCYVFTNFTTSWLCLPWSGVRGGGSLSSIPVWTRTLKYPVLMIEVFLDSGEFIHIMRHFYVTLSIWCTCFMCQYSMFWQCKCDVDN